MELFFNAIKANDIEEVKRLIASGVDVNAKDDDGNTPLILAVTCGYTEIVGLLESHLNLMSK